MNCQKLLHNVNNTIDHLTTILKEYQLEDSGFVGYHLFDTNSGIWTTAEILHIQLKVNPKTINEEWVIAAANYIANRQNKDGGWGFRQKGKSISDITAWVCLALSHFGDQYQEIIINGVKFLLIARKNSIGIDNGGWGLTSYEPDRIYSTWISSNCLNRLLTEHDSWFSSELKKDVNTSITESREWIINSKNKNGGWSPLGDKRTTISSTCFALINIFSQGEDPAQYNDSFKYIQSELDDGLWVLETEVVVTQEGYELAQEWFTSVYGFRVLIFYAELGICSLEQLHCTYNSLLTLFQNDRVKPGVSGTNDLIWPIPLLIEALDKFRIFISRNRKEYDSFLYKKEIEEKQEKKNKIELSLKNQFPYPISQVYFSFSHEIDFHRKFQYLIQLYEILIKYTAIISLSTIISSNEKIDVVKKIIEGRFRRPSLGDWIFLTETILAKSEKIANIISPWTKEDLVRKQTNYIDPESSKMNLSQFFSEMVSLRNNWAGHGAIRSVYEYKLQIEEQIPILFSLLKRFMFLAECNSFLILSSDYNEFGDGDIYNIRVFNGLDIKDESIEMQKRLSEGQKEHLVRYVYFHNMKTNTVVNLYPFVSYMFCPDCKKQRFFFYNGVKKDTRTSYLSFECGHIVEYENGTHFIKRFSALDIEF